MNINSNSDYAKGVVSTVAILVILGAAVRAASWVQEIGTIDAFVAWMTAPRFSVYDAISALMFLVILYAVVWMAAFGPRIR